MSTTCTTAQGAAGDYPIWGIWFDGEVGHSKEEWRADELITMIRHRSPWLRERPDRARHTGHGHRVDFYTQEPTHARGAEAPGRPLAWEARGPLVKLGLLGSPTRSRAANG